METVKGFDLKKRTESDGLCWMGRCLPKTENTGGSGEMWRIFSRKMEQNTLEFGGEIQHV